MNLSKIFCCICCLLSTGKVLGMNTGDNIPQYIVVLVGDAQVGKTQIINKFVRNTFNGEYKASVWVDFSSKTFKGQEKTIKLQIWSIAGQERFGFLIPTYTKNAKAIVFVYDVSNKQSFENLNKWLKNVKSVNNNALYFLFGNKTDLEDNRVVTTEEGKNFAEENNMQFFEVSAKNWELKNVEALFRKIAETCYEKFKNNTEKIINPIGKKSLCKRFCEYCCCCF